MGDPELMITFIDDEKVKAVADKSRAAAPVAPPPAAFGSDIDFTFSSPAPAFATSLTASSSVGTAPDSGLAFVQRPAAPISVKDAFDDLVDVGGVSHDVSPPPPAVPSTATVPVPVKGSSKASGGGATSSSQPLGRPAVPAAASALGLDDLSEEDARVLVSSGMWA